MKFDLFTNHILNKIVFVLSVCFFLANCKEGQKAERVAIKVLFTRFPSSFIKESNKLSGEGQVLFSGIEGNQSKCAHTFILDPLLKRADNSLDTSIITVIEKSGIAAATAVRDLKIIKEHLEEITIPTKLLQGTNQKADSLFKVALLSEKINQDSIIVFTSNKIKDSLTVNGKKFKAYSDVNDTRIRMLSVLCQNPKATLALIIDPPAVVETTESLGNIKTQSNTVTATKIDKVIRTHSYTRRVQSDNGDLTIVKGSEGCDICTRYYSAIDNVGRVRQITQRNSTECCPCGKTIEMRGHTYRMECNEGGSNRLVIAE